MGVALAIGLLGTLASLLGAAVAVWQAKRSRDAAHEAEAVRKQLVNRRKTSELAQLHAACKRAQKVMVKYGAGSTPAALEGISPRNDAAEVQDFILSVREHRELFGCARPNQADQFCQVVESLLADFTEAQTTETLRKNGKQLLQHINNMTSIIKGRFDVNRESVA